MSGQLVFIAEHVWPCHAGGYWFHTEAIVVNAGIAETVGSAVGTAATKWGARRKLAKHKRQFVRAARPDSNKEADDA